MSSWTPRTYKTTNWSDYDTALKQRGSLSIWFDAYMAWEAKPSGQRGRQQAYSDAAIQACLTIKVLFGLPLRQTTGFVESVLAFTGLEWPVPDFSTLKRYAKNLDHLTLPEIKDLGALGRFDFWLDQNSMRSACEPWRAAALCVSTTSRNAIGDM